MGYRDEWDIQSWSLERLCDRYMKLHGRKGKQARDLLNEIAGLFGYKTKYSAQDLSGEAARTAIFIKTLFALWDFWDRAPLEEQIKIYERMKAREDAED